MSDNDFWKLFGIITPGGASENTIWFIFLPPRRTSTPTGGWVTPVRAGTASWGAALRGTVSASHDQRPRTWTLSAWAVLRSRPATLKTVSDYALSSLLLPYAFKTDGDKVDKHISMKDVFAMPSQRNLFFIYKRISLSVSISVPLAMNMVADMALNLQHSLSLNRSISA